MHHGLLVILLDVRLESDCQATPGSTGRVAAAFRILRRKCCRLYPLPTTDVPMNLSFLPEDCGMDKIGIFQGCEIVFVAEHQQQPQQQNVSALSKRGTYANDSRRVFS